MGINVRIPTPLRTLTQNQETVQVEGSNVAEIIDDLHNKFPGLKERICDDNGELRRFVNLYLNNDDIRFKGGIETLVEDGDELSIVPAIAGGM